MLRIRRSAVVVGVVALALVLVGAGCRNPLRKKPEEVLARAQDRMVDASGARIHATLTLDFDVPRSSGARGHFVLTMDGAGSGKTPEDARSEATVTAEATTPEGNVKLVFLERAIGQTAYVQLQDIVFTPKERDASQVQVDAFIGAAKGVIGGKWITIDPQEMATLAQQFGGTNVTIPSPEELRARQEELRATLRSNPIFVVREDLGNDRVGDTTAYHYRIGIRREALSAFLASVSSSFQLPPTTVAEMTQALQDPGIAVRIDGVVGEAWIAKKGNDLRKLAFPINVPLHDGQPTTGTFAIEFSDWGKPVAVEAPADAMKIQDLLGPFLGGILGGGLDGAPALGEPAEALDDADVSGGLGSADVDSDGLTDEQEASYGSDPRVSDTDGDGFSDGTEVGQGYSPTGPGRLTP